MHANFRRMMALALTVAMILTTMLTGMSAPVQAASAPGNIDLAREVAAEGMVLMENRNEALPIPEGTTVAMFGRAQIDYVRGGGGSGNTNVEYTRNILQGMQWWEEEGKISLVPELTSFYTQQVTTNGITNDANITITDEVWNAAASATETAVVTIGRYSSEGSDRNASKGDYYLSDAEVALITRVAAEFENTIVVLNVGAVLDTSWIKGENAIPGVDAVLMAWQAGMEGGLATADVLLGHVNPSGKFVDTFAKDYSDYPSSDTFKESNSYVNYTEDIFVGYRYFETIPGAAERVNYEFGYGLSYTTFDTVVDSVEIVEDEIVVKATVTNTGKVAGKQVVQVYFSAPRGDLTKPAKELAAFDKTGLLAPNASETLTMSFPISDMSSYDDTGVIQKSAYVMEKGDYRFFVGNSVRDGEYVDTVYSLPEDIVVEQLTEYCSPVQLKQRMIESGEYVDVAVGDVISTDLTVAAEGETVLQSEAYANSHETPRIESFYDDNFNRGFCLAYLRADTWVEYTITPELAGQYKVTMCYANGNADLPNCLNVSVNGLPQDGVKFNAIQTGDGSNNSEWYNFTLGEPFYINLYEGENVVRITGNTNNPNYDYMIFERVGEVDGAYERKVAAEGVTKIEAETFNASIVGRPNSEGNTYPVRIEDFTYADGTAAQCLAYMNYRGNGVEYYMNVEQAGQYELVLNGANGRTAYDFRPLVRVQAENGTNVLYRQSISAERTCGGDTSVEGLPDGWYGFADLAPIYIDLPAGNVILSINAQAASFVNVDYFTLEKVGEYNAPGIAVGSTTTVVEAEDYTNAGWPLSKYPNVTETAPESAGAFAGTVCTAHVNYVGNYLSWYLNAEVAGTYSVTLNVANGYDAYTFAPKATINGKEFPVSIDVPSTRDDGEGGTGNRWYNFMDAPSFTVELEEGMNVFTMECVAADTFPNLNSLTFTKLSDNPIVSAEGLTKIEAEAYATTNTAVTESFTAGDYSGQSIGMASRGRYVTYDLYVEEAGTYELALNASNGYAAYELNPGIIVNDKAYPQFVAMPQTCSGGAANPDVPGGWFTFVDVPAATVELPAGEISLTLLSGNTAGTTIRYPNVDYFTLKKVSDEGIDRSVIVDGSAIVEAEEYTGTSISDAVVIQQFGDNEKCLAFMNYQGAYVEYELNVTEPGIYDVALVTSYGYDDTDFMPAIQVLHDKAPDANWNMITCKRTCLGDKTAEERPGYPAGWHTYEELAPLTLALPEGKCTLRLECTDGKYPNVDCIKLEKKADYAAPYHAVNGETVISAIDFNATSRTSDAPVRIEKIAAGALTGQYCLCFMNYPDNTVSYYLDVKTAGQYDLYLSAANGRDAFDFDPAIAINGKRVEATLNVPSTQVTGNRWHNFVDLEPVTVELEEGLNVLSLTCLVQDKFPNISTIKLAPAAAPAKTAAIKSAPAKLALTKSAPAAQADGPIMLVDVYNAGKDENGDYILMDEFLAQMSVEDLIELASAQGNRDAGNTQGWGNIMEYGIPLVMTADGPQGIRISTTCTAWPISTCLASSWDVDVVAAVGKAAATEAHNNNMDIWLAPGMNIHRDPLCGRNFEYYSEDPLVTGKMAASITRATQAEGVAISLKHFAANNKETNRSSSDSRLSERALREIYLKGFEIAVKEADPWTIMSSYNYINGIETSENHDLLTGIARGEWGFDGVFETDWGNNSNHVREMLAGNNIKMTNSQRDALLSAYNSGTISRELLEENATYVLELIMKVNYFLDRYVNIPIVDIDATTNFKAAENILWSSTARGEETDDTDGGMNLGYCDAGAYTQYEINVLTGGTYSLTARVASSAGNGAFNMLIDGEVVASFDVPNTGAYQNWVTIQANDTTPVEIAAGRHTLRFEWTESGSNLNWMSFALQAPSGDDNDDPDDKIDSEELAAAVEAAEAAQAAAEAAQAAAEAAKAEAEAAQAAAEAAAASTAQDKAAAEAAKAAAEAAKAQADAAKAAAETAKTQAQVAAEAAAASNIAAAAEAAKAAEEAAKSAASASTAAGSAADAAEAAEAAQTAQAAAEDAQAAAEEAAASAAEDKAAAEAAQAAAELAQEQAEAAKAAAETAKDAAAASAEAAAASNSAAAEEAAKAAEEAKNAATSASTAAGSAADAAEAAENAQTAQAAAEDAQAAAEEAAASTAEDKSAAEAAQAAAELAQEQAEAAKAAAETAKDAAAASAEAAANSNAEAAAQAAVATAEAKKAAASATAAAGSAKDAAEAAENAQTAQEAAEAAQAAAEEAADSAADDKTAAEAAQAAAELAKAQAYAAKTAAETAQNAAEIAAAAAKEANVEAAEEAAKSAASAKESAESASSSADSAKDAAAAAKAAQDAQAAAEKAQKDAEEAAKDAAADKEAAEKAKEEALKAEEEAKKAAAEAALNLAKYEAQVELNELSAELQATATPQQAAELVELTRAARAAIKEAASEEAVTEALAEAEAALNAALCPSKDFSDVDTTAWYHDAVDFVLNEGMMQGIGNGLFAPDAALSRAMLVQILYNIEGKPAYETELSFTDVAEGAWYYDAVMWAAENEIVLGTGNGTFAPDANVTREQMVTILYRYAGAPEVTAEEIIFADSAEISSWATDAVLWAYENGIVQGVGDNKFAPKDNTTRAATAQVCKNYFGK